MPHTDSLPRQFYSVRELATICGLNPATIRSLIDSGRLKATNISQGNRKRWRIRFADWLHYCELNANQSKPAASRSTPKPKRNHF